MCRSIREWKWLRNRGLWNARLPGPVSEFAPAIQNCDRAAGPSRSRWSVRLQPDLTVNRHRRRALMGEGECPFVTKRADA